MPSPFPGMDPYLEDPKLWQDVHLELLVTLSHELISKMRPRYVARVQYRSFRFGADDPLVKGDPIGNTRHFGGIDRPAWEADSSAKKFLWTQYFLEIREPTNHRVVTVIEVINPSDKIGGSAGQKAFLEKRDEVRNSDTNWFEIDLRRRGTPTINMASVPPSAYRAYADRTTPDGRRQSAWPIHLREKLPRLPIPLRPDEAGVPLDLQSVHDTAYDRAGYDRSINYTRHPTPPLNEDDAVWAEGRLKNRPPSV